MSVQLLRAPATAFETPELADLGDPATRVELTKAAVPAMSRLADSWGLTADRICLLLGGISQSSWYSWKQSNPRELSIDQLTRVSLLLGTYTALHSLFRQPLADEWVTRPNSNPLFDGAAPIEVMTAGGIVALAQVRALLDGARGGL